MTEISGPRRRAPRVDAYDTREAVRLLGPVHRRIGDWQTQAARLTAVSARRGFMDGGQGLVAEAEALAGAIAAERSRLAEQIEALPPSIARNSRFADTLRALDTLAGVVDRTWGLLRADPAPRMEHSAGHEAHGR